MLKSEAVKRVKQAMREAAGVSRLTAQTEVTDTDGTVKTAEQWLAELNDDLSFWGKESDRGEQNDTTCLIYCLYFGKEY